MKTIFALSISFLVFFSSCSKENNPVNPIDPPASQPFYLGNAGSSYSYEETIKWFVPGTDSPFVVVPDSLLNFLQFTSAELFEGYISKTSITYTVDSIPRDYYINQNLSFPYSNYKSKGGTGISYNLSDHLNAIYTGTNYTPHGVSYGVDYYRESDDSLSAILSTPPSYTYLVKPLSVNSNWIITSREYISSGTGNIETANTSAEVVDLVDVSVSAGNFQAYKIQTHYNWPDLNYSVPGKTLYYVPNVGLVLEEEDGIVHIATFNGGSTTTIIVHRVMRKELISFNIVN